MTFATLLAESTSELDTAGTAHTVTLPGTPGTGKLLLLQWGANGAQTLSGTDIDLWTPVLLIDDGNVDESSKWYARVPGGEGATMTVTSSVACRSSHHVWRYDGASVLLPPPGAGVALAIDPPNLDPPGGALDIVWVCGITHANDGSVTDVTGFPASYTGTGENSTAGTAVDGVGTGWARRDLNATSENPGAFTATPGGARATAVTVAVLPLVVPEVAWVGQGAKSAGGTTTITVARPNSGVNLANRLTLAFRAGWQAAITFTDEAGWTSLGSLAGGSAGGVADNHTTEIRGDYDVLAGGESGTVTFDQGGTADGCMGIALTYMSTSGSLETPVASTGTDDTHGTNRSVTGSTALAFAPGDLLVVAVATDTDTALAAFGSLAISASGITFSTPVRRTSGAGVTTGFDGNIEVFEAMVLAGTGTVAPTVAFNTTTNQCGPAMFVRLRGVAAAAGVSAPPARHNRYQHMLAD